MVGHAIPSLPLTAHSSSSMSLPSTHKAAAVELKNEKGVVIKDKPLPVLKDDDILIKVRAVTLNPYELCRDRSSCKDLTASFTERITNKSGTGESSKMGNLQVAILLVTSSNSLPVPKARVSKSEILLLDSFEEGSSRATTEPSKVTLLILDLRHVTESGDPVQNMSRSPLRM